MYKFLYFLLMVNLAHAQKISVMTYNVRLDVTSDKENAWPNRKEDMIAQLKFYAPSIFGIQEGLPHQVAFINKNMESYHFVGQGRDGKDKGEYSAIFYNFKRFSVSEADTFWLSPTPTTVSKGWDAAYPRICTYGLFTDRETKAKFWVFNTHLDHKGELARKKSVSLLLTKIEEVNTQNHPVLFMGDFNMEPQENPIKEISEKMLDAQKISVNPIFGPSGTFNGFKTDTIASRRIDYIFLSKASGYIVEKYGVLSSPKDVKYPSDHFPVYIELDKPKK